MEKYNLVSLAGMFTILGIAFLLSSNKKQMNLKVISIGIIIQFIVATFIFILPVGNSFFSFLNNFVIQILNSATQGSKFVFGRLAIAPGQLSEAGEKSLGFMLGFQAFPTIIFFSALVSLLYFFKIMPFIIRCFAYIFTKLMKISGVESLVTASSIFVGIESILTVKPHLKKATTSEICTILTAGMATVSSNVLALYVFSLQTQFPNIAGHLISASLLSAPAALIMSKILLPESELPLTLGSNISPFSEQDDTLFEAIIKGANSGLKMIVGIVALLIAILGLVSLFDLFIGFAGSKINLLFNINFHWTLKNIMGIIFYPFTIILGIPFSDASQISKIIGERIIVTEVVSYQDLALSLSKGLIKHPRSTVITIYALCGFAHLASMAIFVGGLSSLIPEKTQQIAKIAPKALLAATLACLQTATISGIFFNKSSILLG